MLRQFCNMEGHQLELSHQIQAGQANSFEALQQRIRARLGPAGAFERECAAAHSSSYVPLRNMRSMLSVDGSNSFKINGFWR